MFYLSWINQYLYKLKTEIQYGLTIDKNTLINRMECSLVEILSRLTKGDTQIDFPVQKRIIGRNRTLDMV